MNILLSGASGFIGQQILKQDLNGNICRCVTRVKELKGDGFFFVDTIDEHTVWEKAFSDIDTVIHLAGVAHSKNQVADEILSINTYGTIKFAEEAARAGVKRFVFVSTASIGDTSPFDRKASSLQTQSKYDAEIGLQRLADETGLDLVIVRPTLVYGPNAPGNFGSLARLVCKFPVLPFGLANNRRDFIAVQNLANLLLTCAIHPNASGKMFLASDLETVSIQEFTNAMAEGFEKDVFQLPIPISFMRLIGKITGKSDMIEKLYGDLQVDSSNLNEILEWTPPFTMKQAMRSLHNSSK